MKILARKELLSALAEQNIYYFGKEEQILHKRPISLGWHLPFFIKISIAPFTGERPFVCEVPDTRLLGPDAVGYTPQDEIIHETLLYQKEPPFLSRDNIPPVEMEIDTAASLVSTGPTNINTFHWITERLTLLEGVEHYYQTTKRKPLLIIPKNIKPWQVESLKVMGYDITKDCIRWDFSHLHVKRFILPSLRRYYDGKEYTHHCYSPAACRWLSQKILSGVQRTETEPGHSEKIYISRRKAEWRRILNEEDVINFLTPMGFKVCILEDMNFSEQVRLFSDADIVVGQHGAGMTNIIFSKDISVIELFSQYYCDQNFFCMSSILGFKYGFLMCKTPDRKINDVFVDIASLKRLFKKMGIYR